MARAGRRPAWRAAGGVVCGTATCARVQRGGGSGWPARPCGVLARTCRGGGGYLAVLASRGVGTGRHRATVRDTGGCCGGAGWPASRRRR